MIRPPRTVTTMKGKARRMCEHAQRPDVSLAQSVDWSFSTEHLVAHLIDESDAGLYQALYTDSSVMANIGPALDQLSAERLHQQVVAWNRQSPMRARYWRLVDRGSNEAVGIAALVRRQGVHELGRMIRPARQRHGYGYAALAAMVELSMSGRWGRIELLSVQHKVSAPVAERHCIRLGFTLTSKVDDMNNWQLSRSEWLSGRCIE